MGDVSVSHEAYMRQALRLAERGRGRTSPNPLVGAVIVKAGKIVGSGFHRKAGEPHAEVNAISAAGARARGAALYVNLEPCCHRTKRTPPCTEAIIKSGVRKVVLSMRDPNPKVNGRGIKILRSAGISIVEGILEDNARTINEIYIKYIKKRVPFVILKAAMTLDGKIALGNTLSRWITGEQARRIAHRLRNQVDAVLVGIRTVLADNPRLTTRLSGKRGKDPHRIVLDSRLRIPLNARVLSQSSSATTFIATTRKAPRGKIRKLHDKGAVVLVLPDQNNRVNLKSLMKELGRRGMTSLMIEGGAEVNASALQSGLVDKLIWFVAPKLMGGKEALGVIGGKSPEKLKETLSVRYVRCRKVGDDLMIEGYLGSEPR
jgi:diaminohydroxyphosphoribosylaminopyrimidine deaminase / 5-amino-6-(5-phosphoribosylamino)uracil reductase